MPGSDIDLVIDRGAFRRKLGDAHNNAMTLLADKVLASLENSEMKA